MAIRVEPPSPAPSPAADPAQLAEAARGGSSAALAGLYRLFGPALFRLAYRLTSSKADAEDVVHDVFVGLPEALHHYEERGRFDAWLRRLAARIALMKLRAGRRQAALQLEPNDNQAQPERDREVGELQAAVDALPIPLRSVLVLKEIEGYSHSETAELLGISVVTSRVRLMRAMSRLRRALGGGGKP
jgi:RNA polymerase sigma-70 factor, ECF subfamily